MMEMMERTRSVTPDLQLPSTAGLREASHNRAAIAGASEPNHTVNCEMDH